MITRLETYIATLKKQQGYHKEKAKSIALKIQQQQNKLQEVKGKAKKAKHQPTK